MDHDTGGDPPCWAHLFAEGICTAESPASPYGSVAVDLAGLARAAVQSGNAWVHQSADLNVNLLVFASGEGIPVHVNDEVDVLIVAIAGDGILEIEGVRRPLRAGQAALIAKGARRSLRATSDRFAYLTCHPRRTPLVPSGRRRTEDGS